MPLNALIQRCAPMRLNALLYSREWALNSLYSDPPTFN